MTPLQADVSLFLALRKRMLIVKSISLILKAIHCIQDTDVPVKY